MALDLYEHNANAYVAACEMMDNTAKLLLFTPQVRVRAISRSSSLRTTPMR